jgi:hypothetical protein
MWCAPLLWSTLAKYNKINDWYWNCYLKGTLSSCWWWLQQYHSSASIWPLGKLWFRWAHDIVQVHLWFRQYRHKPIILQDSLILWPTYHSRNYASIIIIWPSLLSTAPANSSMYSPKSVVNLVWDIDEFPKQASSIQKCSVWNRYATNFWRQWHAPVI